MEHTTAMLPPAMETDRERQELAALLATGVFSKAPNLEQVLLYVCSRYFEGASDAIKEYNIAVEALGRPPEFDPKRDSIVRVEAHRLRKRLAEFYRGRGAGHAIEIQLPPGQYVPRFIHREANLPPVAENGAPVQPDTHPAPSRRPPWRWRWWVWALVGAAAAVALVAGVPWRAASPTAAPQSQIPLSSAAPVAVRILCGTSGGDYVDRAGRLWKSDRYFEGGSVYESQLHHIAGALDSHLYDTRREGSFRYDIPLAPGAYEMRLHFAETVYGENNPAGGGESSRVFHVLVNGREVLHEFDIIADVGAGAADIRAFRDLSPAPDGKLHLTFTTITNAPFLNAIELAPGTPGRTLPIRLVAQDRPYIDKLGRTWEPDAFAMGGQIVRRTDPVGSTGEPGLYRGERYGNLKYVVPAAPGVYAVTFYFSETWFGPSKPGKGGAGSRIFDILANGVALRRDFDIYKEAGGSDRALAWTAHGLQPNHQGQLVISLVPVLNYACVNAIEIIEEKQ